MGRLIEEDQLNPISRAKAWSEKARWRRRHPDASARLTVWIVGAQRSGTNLVSRLLDAYPEVELYNENHNAAFDRFELKGNAQIGALIGASKHEVVVFKPLCDSDRMTGLLADFDAIAPGKALWVYRGVDARVRSAVSKFGSANRDVLVEIVADPNSPRWQARGLSAQAHSLLADINPASLDDESGSALFWYLRNSLFFDEDLDSRDDVMLVKYEWLVSDPGPHWAKVLDFLGMSSRPEVVEREGIRPAVARDPLEIDPRVRALCDELGARLDAAMTRQFT